MTLTRGWSGACVDGYVGLITLTWWQWCHVCLMTLTRGWSGACVDGYGVAVVSCMSDDLDTGVKWCLCMGLITLTGQWCHVCLMTLTRGWSGACVDGYGPVAVVSCMSDDLDTG